MKISNSWSILLCLLTATYSLAEDSEEEWDVNAIPGEAREDFDRYAYRYMDESRRKP